MTGLNFTASAYGRILEVARIAELDGQEHIQSQHVGQAIPYCTLDRRLRG